MLVTIGIGSTNVVRLDNLANSRTGAYINDATVSFVLTQKDGTVVQAETTMDYQTSSNGRYEGMITSGSAAGLSAEAQYVVQISVTSGSSQLFRRVLAQPIYEGT